MSKNVEVPTLSEAVGRAIKALREAHSLRQEDITRHARDVGLDWAPSTVGNLELGRIVLSADEVALIPVALHRALVDSTKDVRGRGLPGNEGTGIPELVARYVIDDGGLLRVGNTEVRIDFLSRLLGGDWMDLEHAENGELRTPDVQEGFRRIRDRARLRELRRLWPGATDEQLGVAVQDADRDAERKLAKRLGDDVDADAVAVTAHALWGRGLTAEREARLAERVDGTEGTRAAQTMRGHISRALALEIERELKGEGHGPR